LQRVIVDNFRGQPSARSFCSAPSFPQGLQLSPEKTRVIHIDEASTSSASTAA